MLIISFMLFFIPIDQFEQRISLVMTALLGVLVFHMSQGDKMPNIGYLMKADLYFIYSYVYLLMLIINTITVNLFVKKGKTAFARTLERTGSGIYSLLISIAYICLTIVKDNFLSIGAIFIAIILFSYPINLIVSLHKKEKRNDKQKAHDIRRNPFNPRSF